MGIPPSSLGQATRSVFGERRYVTVLFSDISGSTEHAERLEAEEYADLLRQFRNFARAIIPRHGGSIARIQGDGVLALFGHVSPNEEDGRHAVEAALELHASVSTLRAGKGAEATPLQMHSGIHGGLVLLIEGDIERGRHDVVGDVPNTAARLCSLAEAGFAMVSSESLGPFAHFFQCSPAQNIRIKGRAAPLNVLRVQGKSALKRRIDASARRGEVPFLGRQDALNLLLDATQRLHSGSSTVIAISGEPGIGKTRLMDELRARLDPARFHVTYGACESDAISAPLRPFKQALQRLVDLSTDAGDAQRDDAVCTALCQLGLDPNEAASLSQALTNATSTPTNAAPRSISFARALDALAQQRPMVLLLDDWQWADDASRHVLETLLARHAPLLVVIAVRAGHEDDVLATGAQELRLNPLEAPAAEQAIEAWLPGCDPFLVQEIYQRSGGTPLFMEELCHAAALGHALPAFPRGSGVAWINSLVASRFARLPRDEASALQTASVLGNSFPSWLLAQVTGNDNTPRLVEALVMRDFLSTANTEGMVHFKHGLTRDAIYATLDSDARRHLHARVAAALEAHAKELGSEEGVESLAHHHDAASSHEAAARYAEAAGDNALAALALDRARGHYITALRNRDALPSLGPGGQRHWCQVVQKLGQACVFDPLGVAQGLSLFRRAAEYARLTEDDNAIARAEYWLGYVNYGRGRPRHAVHHCETALLHAQRSADGRLHAQVQATLGQALASAGLYDAALPMLRQAVDSKRQFSRPGSGVAIGSAYTVARTGYTLGDLGRFDEAHACFDEALQLLGHLVHPVEASVRELICAVHLWEGRWAEAAAAARTGVTVALRCRSHYLVAMGRALGACAEWAQHRQEESLHTLREATAWIESHGGAVSTSLNYGWLVEACCEMGRDDEAHQHAVKLFQRARALDRHGLAQGCRALARRAATKGQGHKALRHLAWADEAAARRRSPREQGLNDQLRAELLAEAALDKIPAILS